MEWKQGKKDEVQDRSDVNPGEHGDGERACGFSWQALIGRLSLARKLRLDRLTVEENEPPEADQKRHAVDDEDNPAERLHALGWQIGGVRSWRKRHQKRNGDPNDTEKNRQASPKSRSKYAPTCEDRATRCLWRDQRGTNRS